VSAKQGHHENTFIGLELAVGPPVATLAKYFNTCRKKRNTVDYNLANVVTETEVRELLKTAKQFRTIVEGWICQNHPSFA
jgi:hypothetical protein